jgi:tRNA uridine 5-carboxymethylaminomethyl modification enzyme
MGRAIDDTFVQVRLVNTGKGPAVQTLRAQADKKRYQERMKLALETQPGLVLRQGLVEQLLCEGDSTVGVMLQGGAVYHARAVVLTTGTYLSGRIVLGDTAYSGGPNGQFAATKLSQSLRQAGIELGRFKTGTPPRVNRETVDFSRMVEQPGDEGGLRFSYGSQANDPDHQLSCWLTYTNARTHAVIAANLDRAPLYNGSIEGVGPRYCPSIEDKIKRFADRERHPVFIEPEGWQTAEMYVQGFSTSLPEDVQEEALHTIAGLEHAEIMRYGYAIEYDYIVPEQLTPDLAVRCIRGLYSAGQINGSSGYEEAAGQGLVAGVNAAFCALGRNRQLVLDRSQAYIGVLIDDLLTKGIEEPYRLMTARSEFRLLLRHDNADERLTPIGREIGLVGDERFARFEARKSKKDELVNYLNQTHVKAADVNGWLETHGSAPVNGGVVLAVLLQRPELDYGLLCELDDHLCEFAANIAYSAEIEVKYSGYIAKEEEVVARMKRLEGKRLPETLDYGLVPSLSFEGRLKLSRFRPATVGQAGRIAGVSPADIAVLLVYLEGSGRRGLGSQTERK